MLNKQLKLFFLVFFLVFINLKTMAQSNIIIHNKTGNKNTIYIQEETVKPAAILLKSYLDKSFMNPFFIKVDKNSSKTETNTTIHLKISNYLNQKNSTSFLIKSDSKDIFLIAPDIKLLRYAVYTLLEIWGFRKFTSTDTYIPKLKNVEFPKNTTQNFKPSFEYRVLLYPDAYDEDFRDWHKLDWHLNDFSVWGHSFDKLLPPKEYFKINPEYYALYEGKRRAESFCMTNNTVVDLVITKIKKIVAENSKASFFSVSQNDDVVYCECAQCKLLNEKYGGPQGSLYYFLNKIAVLFPETRITTLAYLHTYKPPIGLKLEPNIYTLFCPIELNRGKSIINDAKNKPFIKLLENWHKTGSNLYLWDYTVQFSNYLSPFPNLHTLSDNYKLYKVNNVKGVFVQGYADVPGDLSELRQYLLAKILFNTETNIETTTDDFLRGFYGKAAFSIKKYLTLLTENQKNSNADLDIYSGPVQSRNTFLSPEAMNQYDQLLDEALAAVDGDLVLESKINKLRLALEFVFFEQSKFYGNDQHGMFVINDKGEKQVRNGLTERVRKFTETCNQFGIYELSEGRLSPNKYNEDWLEIAKETTTHLGEKIQVNFLTPPAAEFFGKGSNGLVDGARGYNDFNINWIGWYGTNPEIELETKKINFNQIKLNFLNDQRHWIFLPKKISIYGFKNRKWNRILEKNTMPLTEDNIVARTQIVIHDNTFSTFEKIKVVVKNQDELPAWRKRKNKKPMVMIDEIELYKNETPQNE